MKNKLIGIIICMLLVGTVLPVSGTVIINNKNENTLFDSDGESGRFRWGFILGPIESIEKEGDILILEGGPPVGGKMWQSLRFFIPFSMGRVLQFQQIKIQFKYGILRNDFVLGICRIYIPKSEISMHIVTHNDQENKVTWEIDEINGDPIWEFNIHPYLYSQSGEDHCRSWGPIIRSEYLSIGDQLDIKADRDGYFKLKITDWIFGDVLFEMDSVKF
jgi:hypothetical protein